MLNSVFAVVLAAGIAAGVAFREAVVALLYDPPVVMCAGDWCSGCRRVPGGVEITAESAPDVVFSFEGLAAEVPLGYVVSEVASGAELFSGEGALVPLSLVSDTAVKVRFYALSGEVDWSEVSAVSAVQSEPLAASEDTTHNKMGMSINASDAVITGILTIAYPDGTEQSIEL